MALTDGAVESSLYEHTSTEHSSSVADKAMNRNNNLNVHNQPNISETFKRNISNVHNESNAVENMSMETENDDMPSGNFTKQLLSAVDKLSVETGGFEDSNIELNQQKLTPQTVTAVEEAVSAIAKSSGVEFVSQTEKRCFFSHERASCGLTTTLCGQHSQTNQSYGNLMEMDDDGDDEKEPRKSLISAVNGGDVDLVTLLLCGAVKPHGKRDVNVQDQDMRTPLHIAVEKGHMKVAALLITAGADVDTQDKNGATPLHIAVARGCVESTELLLDANCEVNTQNSDQRTPLHIASSMNNVALVKLLLSHGADRCIEDKERNRPVELVQSPSQVFRLLRDTQADLIKAAKDGNCDQLKELFRTNTVQNTLHKDESNRSLLHFACWFGHMEIVQLLSYHQVPLSDRDSTFWTPLHYACFNGHDRIVEYLLSEGVDTNMVNEDGDTPLHIAAREGELNIVLMLVESVRTDLTLRNKDGARAVDMSSDEIIANVLQRAMFPGKYQDGHNSNPYHQGSSGPTDIMCGLGGGGCAMM